MFLFANEPSGQWMLIAAGAIIGVWLLMRRPFKARLAEAESKLPKVEPKQTLASGLSLRPAPDDYTQFEVAMHETARELKGELDSKMVALQALVALAQRETARLEEAILRAERGGVSSSRDARTDIERLADGHPPSLSPSTFPSSSSSAIDLPPKLRDKIYAQADEGHSPAAIAANVRVPIGDVEWTLNLRGTSAT